MLIWALLACGFVSHVHSSSMPDNGGGVVGGCSRRCSTSTRLWRWCCCWSAPAPTSRCTSPLSSSAGQGAPSFILVFSGILLRRWPRVRFDFGMRERYPTCAPHPSSYFLFSHGDSKACRIVQWLKVGLFLWWNLEKEIDQKKGLCWACTKGVFKNPNS